MSQFLLYELPPLDSYKCNSTVLLNFRNRQIAVDQYNQSIRLNHSLFQIDRNDYALSTNLCIEG